MVEEIKFKYANNPLLGNMKQDIAQIKNYELIEWMMENSKRERYDVT